MISRIVAFVMVIPGLLSAQAAAEAAIGSAKAAITTAPAAEAAGKAIGAGFDKLEQVLKDAVGTKPSQGQVQSAPSVRARSTVTKRRPAPAVAKAVPTLSYEDPADIKEGMEYDEVIRRFGPPAMKFTSGPVEELLTYAKKDQSFDVQMRNGRVTVIQKTGGSDPAR